MDLTNLFVRIETLMLQVKKCEAHGIDHLYSTLAMEDKQCIVDLHTYAVDAVARGPQRWAQQVSRALNQACTNARSYSRKVPASARPDLLNLNNIAFQNNVIGLDELKFCAPPAAESQRGRSA